VSLSGFGNTGPRVAEGAYDVTIQALAGWMSLTGGPDEPPTKSGLSLVDFAGGYVAALSLLSAVWQARRDGAGKDVDVSLFESALALQTYMATWTGSRAWSAQRIADSAHQSIVPFQLLPAADGWLMVACAKESLWRKLCDAIERPELTRDLRFSDMAARSRHRVELVTLLKDVFRKRSVSDWINSLSSFDIPCAPVNSLEEALADEQSVARGSVVDYDHPVLGRVTTVKSPLGSTMTRPPDRAPFLGESTVDVLENVCGYDSSRIDELGQKGAFGANWRQAPSGMHAR
jgi:crotonobetainyl-CoA:carnitine CoA-transferase CaiB-like acyl-CoA transferase